MQPDWPIETERLTLRPFVEADFDAFFAIHGDRDVARWLLNDARTESEARAQLARKSAGTGWPAAGDWLSCAALVDWAFGAGIHRVYGRPEPRNTASARVLEKLGMRREAHFVENEWVKGEWQSELVYAILDCEWH